MSHELVATTVFGSNSIMKCAQTASSRTSYVFVRSMSALRYGAPQSMYVDDICSVAMVPPKDARVPSYLLNKSFISFLFFSVHPSL